MSKLFDDKLVQSKSPWLNIFDLVLNIVYLANSHTLGMSLLPIGRKRQIIFPLHMPMDQLLMPSWNIWTTALNENTFEKFVNTNQCKKRNIQVNFPQFSNFKRKSTCDGVMFDAIMFGGALVELGLGNDQNVFENLQNVFRNICMSLDVVGSSSSKIPG